MAATAQFTTNAIFAGNNNGQTNQIWRYNEGGDPTGTGWETKNFDDSFWPAGQALLAFESGWVVPFRNTILTDPRTANTPTNPPSGHARYFRTHFNWPTNPVGVTLNFNARCDDGAIIYLNGTEIFRLRPPPEPITHAQVGSPLPCGGDADCGDDVFSVSSPALVQGDNVLAVAVYQNATGSSDVAWGTGLSGTLPVPLTITDPNQPSNRVVAANHATTLNMLVTGLPAPTFQWFFQPSGGGGFNPVVDGPGISGATNASLTISNMALTDAGSYFCTARNPVGMTNSRTAVVQFTEDTNAPVMVEAIGSASFDRINLVYSEQVEPVSATDTFNYTIEGPNATFLGIDSITLNADGSSVTILTSVSTPQTPDTLYTITVNNVTDRAPLANTIAPDSMIGFRSWIPTLCGGVLFEAYNAGGGNTVSVLTSHPSFPNNPDFRTVLPELDIRTATVPGPGDPNNPGFYNTDARESYGGRLRGLFIATESGPHVFFFASDDNGELWLSTDAQPSNKTRIARESGWSASKEWTTSGGGSVLTAGGKRSAPINLQAGHAYYIEALYKEGGGGDNCAVAVQPPSQASPPANGSGAIPSGQLGATAVPPGIGGTINFSQQPANSIVDAPAQATFSAVATASAAPFVCYQWQKAEAGGGGTFSDIPGATGPNFTTPITTVAADNGDMYRVVVRAFASSATSVAATLTVNVDVTRPTVVKVVPTNATTVAVVYSEGMNPSAATDLGNYSLSGGIAVQSAAINTANPNRVDLTTTPMTSGTLYTLTMKGPGQGGTLADVTGNAISPNPAVVTFRAQTYGTGVPVPVVETVVTLPTAGKLPLGSLSTRGILVRFVQVSAAIVNNIAVAEQMLDGVYPNATSPLPNIAPVPLHLETGMINYNKDGPGTMDGSLVPDAQYPGFGSVSNAVLDNLAMEAVTYLELRQGLHRMVVRSDDNFRLTPALSADDPGNAFIIGEFNVAGGRGVADTPLVDFIVNEDGLYPMRLVYEEGQGGAAVEWKIQNLETGSYFGVNGSPIALAGGGPGSGPPSYTPPCANKALTIQRSGANLILTWPKSAGGNLFQLQQAAPLANPSSATAWSNVNIVPKTSGPSKSVTVPAASAARYYRLFRPGPPCTP